jgi:hypothetical protein
MRSVLVWCALSGVVLAGLYAWPPSRDFFVGNAENTLGVLYARGILVGRDDAAAVDWYRRAAERGRPAAQFNLAFALHQGAGAAADRTAAAEWYRRAAENGVALAANNLGMMYLEDGNQRSNLEAARHWLELGLPAADPELAATMRDELAQVEHALARSAAASRPAEVRAPPPLHVDAAAARRQTEAALAAAKPLREAASRWVVEHRGLPPPDVLRDPARFAPVDAHGVHAAIGTGGEIAIRLTDGPLGGQEFSLVPLVRAGRLSWICAKGALRAEFFGRSCS